MFERKITTIWHEWSAGEVPGVEDSVFQEIIFDKVFEGYRARLVFEVDICNRIICSIVYPRYPDGLEVALRRLGELVLKVEAGETFYRVEFKNGHWFQL